MMSVPDLVRRGRLLLAGGWVLGAGLLLGGAAVALGPGWALMLAGGAVLGTLLLYTLGARAEEGRR